MRFAIVGLGNAARTIHIPALRKLEQTELVGGFDARASGEAPGFPLYSSLDQMLNEARPDFLVVATPPDTHFEIARLGLEAGCHVFCEKPLTDTAAQAGALAALVARTGRHVVVNSEFPWMPIHAVAKQRMREPGFGALRFVNMHQTFRVTTDVEQGWRGAGRDRMFKEFGTHVLDLAKFFFDAEPVSVRARMPRPMGPDQADYLSLIELEFPGERFAHIVLDRLSKGRHRYLDIRLDGAEATIETSIGGRLQATLGVQAKTRSPFLDVDIAMGGQARLYRGERHEHLARAPLDLFADATARLLRDVIAALAAGQEPPCSLRQARATLGLLLACYDSATDGLPRRVTPCS